MIASPARVDEAPDTDPEDRARDETEDEQPLRESEQALDRAMTHLPPD